MVAIPNLPILCPADHSLIDYQNLRASASMHEGTKINTAVLMSW